MASSDDDEQKIIIGNDDDDRYWLPIIPDQDDSAPSSPMPLTSSQPPQCEWANVIHEYGSLMSSKASMDRRKFNKSVFLLLNKTITLAKDQMQQTMMQKPITNPEQAFIKYREELLNPKEMKSEELVANVVAYVNNSLPALLTADERKEELQKKSISLLQDLSPQMSIKLAPIVRSYISRQLGCAIEDMLAEVHLPELSLKEKTSMYTRMIDNFLDDVGCLSFALSNRQLLGNITPVDLWFLTFFAFVTVRRCRGDNLLMLGCVGESSTIHVMTLFE